MKIDPCKKALEGARKQLNKAVDALNEGKYTDFDEYIKTAKKLREGMEAARCAIISKEYEAGTSGLKIKYKKKM